MQFEKCSVFESTESLRLFHFLNFGSYTQEKSFTVNIINTESRKEYNKTDGTGENLKILKLWVNYGRPTFENESRDTLVMPQIESKF